jgi:hypothetical protein
MMLFLVASQGPTTKVPEALDPPVLGSVATGAGSSVVEEVVG